MTSPLVSVLLPVRDGGRFLADAIRSITQQTFADFEVVAVDDGSADDTRDLLDSWVRSDFRVTVIRQGALGLVPALETARRQARGEFLARMDADDVAEPRRLELQLDLLRRDPELVGCGCRVEYFPEGEVRDGARRYERWINSLIRPEDIEKRSLRRMPARASELLPTERSRAGRRRLPRPRLAGGLRPRHASLARRTPLRVRARKCCFDGASGLIGFHGQTRDTAPRRSVAARCTT